MNLYLGQADVSVHECVHSSSGAHGFVANGFVAGAVVRRSGSRKASDKVTGIRTPSWPVFSGFVSGRVMQDDTEAGLIDEDRNNHDLRYFLGCSLQYLGCLFIRYAQKGLA